jgi:hypothetical protein
MGVLIEVKKNQSDLYSKIINGLANLDFSPEEAVIKSTSFINSLVDHNNNDDEVDLAKKVINIIEDESNTEFLAQLLSDRALAFPVAVLLGCKGRVANQAIDALVKTVGWGPGGAVFAASKAIKVIGGYEESVVAHIKMSFAEKDDVAYQQLILMCPYLDFDIHNKYPDLINEGLSNPDHVFRELTQEYFDYRTEKMFGKQG